MSSILVIKHGALGDAVMATGPFAAIRRHHAGDRITLLTAPAFADLLRKSGYFDEVWTDSRPKLLFHPFAFLRLISQLSRGSFSRVYDLQTSERTNWYFRLMKKPRPEWSGIAEGASHRHNTPERTSMHTVDRQKQQLEIAGINDVPPPNVDWLSADVSHFALPERYALIVPGGSSHRPGKRWPAIHYASLCAKLLEKDITPLLIGTKTEATVLSTIEHACPGARNLSGKTDFAEVASLARGAVCAVGNDTGPMHIIATAGCPSVAVFSNASNPALCAPRGRKVVVLQKEQLADLKPARVLEEVEKFL